MKTHILTKWYIVNLYILIKNYKKNLMKTYYTNKNTLEYTFLLTHTDQ